jgi:putative hydrolase of the HAD superfamily
LEEQVLLIEDLGPVRSVADGYQDGDDAPLATLLDRMHVPAPGVLPDVWSHVVERQRNIERATRRLPPHARDLAAGAFRRLGDVPRGRALLHGDLHTANVVRTDHGLRVIDPYGLEGDTGYDAAFLAATIPGDPDAAVRRAQRLDSEDSPTAADWLRWVAVYRLDNALRFDLPTADWQRSLVDALASQLDDLAAVCFDFGDTLIDEATERKSDGVTVEAKFLPGALDAIAAVRRRGLKLGLVADGRPESYENVLSAAGIRDHFAAVTVSRAVGVEKPNERIFLAALRDLGLSRADAHRVLFVGNRLDRDIVGANQVGMQSVWLRWSSRYSQEPASRNEAPGYTVSTLKELERLLDGK